MRNYFPILTMVSPVGFVVISVSITFELLSVASFRAMILSYAFFSVSHRFKIS